MLDKLQFSNNLNISVFSLKLPRSKMDAVGGPDNEVIDLTKSPPDPAPAPPQQNLEVAVPVSSPGLPFIRPRVLFPVSGSLVLPPLVTNQVNFSLRSAGIDLLI